jgi:hypothetical protein
MQNSRIRFSMMAALALIVGSATAEVNSKRLVDYNSPNPKPNWGRTPPDGRGRARIRRGTWFSVKTGEREAARRRAEGTRPFEEQTLKGELRHYGQVWKTVHHRYDGKHATQRQLTTGEKLYTRFGANINDYMDVTYALPA